MCVCVYAYTYTHTEICRDVGLERRWVLQTSIVLAQLLKFKGFFCKRAPLKRLYSAKETIVLARMGWLQVVGSLESYVSFAEYCLFDRALLQKRLIVLRSLPIVATP